MTSYVGYFSESPCDPRRFASLAEAIREFRDDNEFMENHHADLYRCTTDEDWQVALSFTGVGCPFDGIDIRLTIGKRGGVVQERG
jgi:hypothetical protein